MVTVTTQRVIHVSEMKPGDTYIGRAVPRKGIWHDSPWANPFAITSVRRAVGYKVSVAEARLDCIRLFEDWVRSTSDERAAYIREHLDELQGDLGCWCRDEKHPSRPCHGTVLLKLKAEAGL